MPRLIYDGDCAFCTSCVHFLKKFRNGRISEVAEIVPFQRADLTPELLIRAQYELLWIANSGRIFGGVQAISQALGAIGGGWHIAAVALRIPPLRWLGHWIYRAIANNRSRLPGGTAACAITPSPVTKQPPDPNALLHTNSHFAVTKNAGAVPPELRVTQVPPAPEPKSTSNS